MNNFGELIRAKREEKEMLLRHLAAQLDIDTAQLSKMERGERTVKREHVIQLIDIFNLDPSKAFSVWLSDQIIAVITNEEEALSALKMAEDQIKELNKSN